MSTSIRHPVSTNSTLEQLKRDAPEVAEALERVVQDTPINFRDKNFAAKKPGQAGTRTPYR